MKTFKVAIQINQRKMENRFQEIEFDINDLIKQKYTIDVNE